MIPVIILMSPQLGENIGAAARAMHNFGLDDLRLIAPLDGWPNQAAIDVARNAGGIIERTGLYNNIVDATFDITSLYATTARPRDMVKTAITPRQCASTIRKEISADTKSAIIFGPERTGLSGNDLVLADYIVTIPASIDNTSLNLAQAVLVLCYEWFVSDCAADSFTGKEQIPATKAELAGLLKSLECELDKNNFFHPPAMRHRKLRNLNNIFTRAKLTGQETKTLRGVIRSLVGGL